MGKHRDRRVMVIVVFFMLLVVMALRWEWSLMREKGQRKLRQAFDLEGTREREEAAEGDGSGGNNNGNGNSGEEAQKAGGKVEATQQTEWGYNLAAGSTEYWSTVEINCKHSEPIYTAADLHAHSTEQSLWLNVRGYVVDVTDFRTSHPGGDAILTGVEIDAADLFENAHQPFVGGMLGNFCIGRMAPDTVFGKKAAGGEEQGQEDKQGKENAEAQKDEASDEDKQGKKEDSAADQKAGNAEHDD
ncbi:Acyl-lipid (8-3)-desaturase [Diplonema papillatum]|nr:Acyl-lipid (8-3)-desaturase [Diplonema papillatum]|eukprot:gene20202-31062_t